MTNPQEPGQYPGGMPGATSGGDPAQPDWTPLSPGTPDSPSGMPPYPTMPYPSAAYPMAGFPVLAPSGGTAITAGVLAALGALWAILMCAVNFGTASAISMNPATSPVVWVVWMQGSVGVIELVTLGAGSIMLFMRKSVARWLVAGGSAVHILQGIIGFSGLLAAGLIGSGRVSSGAMFGGSIFGVVSVLSPAIATLILVLLPQTARWCEWGRQPAGMVPYGTMPPGMPQQPYGMPPGGTQQPPQW